MPTSTERYLPDVTHEFPADDSRDPDDAGVYCAECPGYPFVEHEDIAEHDRLHVERAARIDPDQGSLL